MPEEAFEATREQVLQDLARSFASSARSRDGRITDLSKATIMNNSGPAFTPSMSSTQNMPVITGEGLLKDTKGRVASIRLSQYALVENSRGDGAYVMLQEEMKRLKLKMADVLPLACFACPHREITYRLKHDGESGSDLIEMYARCVSQACPKDIHFAQQELSKNMESLTGQIPPYAVAQVTGLPAPGFVSPQWNFEGHERRMERNMAKAAEMPTITPEEELRLLQSEAESEELKPLF